MSLIYSKRYKDLLKKLVEAREKAGLTQEQVASKLNKHQSFVSKIESGERRVDFIEVEELANIYKLPVNYFQTLIENDSK